MNRTISILMILAAMLVGAGAAFAENINIYDTGTEPLEIDCSQAASQGGTSIFLYDDGGTGQYQANQSYSMTLNANNGGYIALYFEEFNLAQGTLMSIRNEVTQEMLVSNAGGTTLRGNNYMSINGSITIIWTSGATRGAGFKARVYCGHDCQRFFTNINIDGITATTETNPDTHVTETFYDVCPGTQVQFHAVNDFFQNGNNGYTQTDANVTYSWAVINSAQDTVPLSGQNPSYTFNESGGYFVICTSRDQQECYNRNANKTKIRVSVRPTWTASFSPDSICPGTQISMQGEPHVQQWEWHIPTIFGERMFIPDGDNSCYRTSLQFDIFEEGATITSMNDFDRVYLNLEHSFLGDLAIMLECPNGQLCMLHHCTRNTPPGWSSSGVNVHTPGSVDGSGTHLGLAHDDGNCNNYPGYGFPYYFYPDGNEAFGSSGTQISVNRSEYQDSLECPSQVQYTSILAYGENHRYGPYQNMSSLIGCPLNGTWTIHICDFWSIDNGWIFEWGLYFRDDLYPSNLWQFNNNYTTNGYAWSGVGMQSGMNGSATATAVVQNSDDNNWAEIPYTFSATDNFSCTYDTTLVVHVKPAQHEDCCRTPSPTASCADVTGSQIGPCGFSTTLVGNAFAYPGNTGEWTYVGPGTASFRNIDQPETEVTVNVEGAYTFTWHEYYLGNQSCTGEASVTVDFARPYDATLSPIDNACRSGNMIILEAPDFGTLTCTAVTTGANSGDALNVDARTFTPSLVTIPGTFRITNTIPPDNAHGCTDPRVSSQEFTIYDELTVSERTEDCLSAQDRTVAIGFEVHGVADPSRPPTYVVTGSYTEYAETENPNPVDNYNSGPQTTVNFSLSGVHSGLDYALVVTDANGCSNVNVPGYFQCNCPNVAGTFDDYSAHIMCTGEVYENGHNDDFEIDDNNGVFSYIICTNPTDIQNTTCATILGPQVHGQQHPAIASSDIQNFRFGQQYYLVAVAGYGQGLTAWGNGCRSVSQAVPLMWKQTPTPAATAADTCGLVIRLNGSQPPEGMYGYWSVATPPEGITAENYNYTTIEGTNNNSHNAVILANEYGLATFRWNVVNAECTGSTTAQYNLRRIPRPNAGNDTTVCGVTAVINTAYGTHEDYTLQWTGAGVSFNPSNSIQPQITANTGGTYQLTLTERNGECAGSSTVNITFVNIPAPATTANVDTVCGNVAEIQVYNTNPAMEGRWTAYDMNGNVLPTVSYSDYDNPTGPNSARYPHCYVTVPIPNDTARIEYEFRWTEPVDDPRLPEGLSCDGMAVKRVVFCKQPVVSVSECGVPGNNQMTVCGKVVELCSSSPSTDFARFAWVVKDVGGTFSDPSGFQTTFTIDTTTNIDRYMDVDFYFTGTNASCMAIDTMHVRFIQKPVANAGLDHAACGLSYTLNGNWSMQPSPTYTPVGEWTVGETPEGATVNWATAPATETQEDITVTHYGIYTFIFRETNNWGDAASCYDRDTVTVEFMEQPSVYAGEDFPVCGTDFELNATSSHVEGDSIRGQWICLSASGDIFDDPYNPHTTGHYTASGSAVSATFRWVETNHPHIEVDAQETCAGQSDITVTFYPQPSARINMGPGDTAVCGLEYEFLKADLPGDGITGMWYEESPLTMFGPQNAAITSPTAPASVTSYGRHEYYWILYALVEGQDPSFCTDTAGPWHIDFIQQPTAQIAETEHTFCGYYGELSELHVSSSVGTGTWSSSISQNIVSFNEANNPGTIVNTTILNSGNTQYPYFDLYWTVANTQYCTAADTVRVIFAKIPSGEFSVIPPKCFGEPAIITATDNTLPTYTWEYPGAFGDDTVSNTNGGNYRMFIHWDKDNMLANGDSVHNVTLVTTNEWGCSSAMGSLNISEPRLLEYTPTIMGDVCGAGTGYVQFADTTIAFIWIDTVAGDYPITAADSFRVSNLREGEYSYRTVYQTFNTNYRVQYFQYFGNESCIDTLTVEVPRTGDINLSISVNGVDLDGLVAPQQITFTVDTTGDGNRVPYVWMWDYDDGTQPRTSSSFASGAQHSYQEAGEFHPTLTVWVETDPKCRAEAVFNLDIKEKSEIDVPNIFSPNGDNINDYFQVKVKPNTISKFHGTILNRYGRVVFEWEDCYTETAGWDGRLNGSTKATPGVYYYIIDAEGIDGQTFEKRGALQLVKE